MRRLTETQYRNAIADLFGPSIEIKGRFERIVRPELGLIATGAMISSVSPAGFEQYDILARGVAAQVLSEEHRQTFMPCEPTDPAAADPACARAFLDGVARYMFRRPLTPLEVEPYVRIASLGVETSKDFYSSLTVSLASMLVSPEFLYQVDAAAPNGRELNSYSKAVRLSFLLWNTTPDEMLIVAAERGDLDTPRGLRAQVDRLMASPRLEQGVRAFFSDFLSLERVSDVSKDPAIYSRFNTNVANELPEQLLRTIVDHLITADRPYPELFTTRRTFLTRRLGVVYSAPVAKNEWTPYEFPDDEERVGLLGQGSFLALFSHEGRSSPTLRGKAIREVLMCQPVPMPPANVDFTRFNDTSGLDSRTARQRLGNHSSDPVCASCHKITDPIGLALERFDGIGAFRLEENGAMIDTSGEFDGQSFEDARDLGSLMAQSKVPADCLATRLAEYATGLGDDNVQRDWLARLQKDFEADGFNFRALMRKVAVSPELYAISTQDTKPAITIAALGANSAPAKLEEAR